MEVIRNQDLSPLKFANKNSKVCQKYLILQPEFDQKNFYMQRIGFVIFYLNDI